MPLTYIMCAIVAKLRATKTHAPEGLDTVRCAFGFSNWMFEALSHGLVKVPTKEMEERVSLCLHQRLNVYLVARASRISHSNHSPSQ